MADELRPWAPLTPGEVDVLLADLSVPWWLAGGFAIELYVGRPLREHGDIDVMVLRPDQLVVRERLADWDVHAADPPGTLRPWPVGETLPGSVHDIWCRPTPEAPWSLQLMIDDADGPDWVYRRDSRVRRPLAELDGPASRPGRRVLAPENQLLYKSGSMREKDITDFLAASPLLDPVRRTWLRDALAVSDPEHPWLDDLHL